MFQDIGKKIGKFYFGIGGIGDLFLLLSSYYDTYYDSWFKKRKNGYEDEDISLVFWANNPSLIKEILKHIPNHKHVLVTENFLNKPQLAMKYYDQIANDSMFQGKGHIPDNLRYIEEWVKVENVFEHYNLTRYPQFVRSLFYDESIYEQLLAPHMVIQPYSYDDNNIADKKREIKSKNLRTIFEDFPVGKEYGAIVGSPREQQWFRENAPMNNSAYHFTGNIIEAIKYVVTCEHVYAVDSWAKTVAGLAGVPTTYYTYLADQKEIFPTIGYDPSDNIFIKNWNFKIIDQKLQELFDK